MKKNLFRNLFILIVIVSGLLIIGTLTNSHGWGDDFAGYIMQAKSITEGSPRAYLELNRFIIEQSTNPNAPIAYPWGYPLLLAPIYALFGLNLLALKSVAAISYLLFIVSLWFVFRNNHLPVWFLLFVSLFAFNPRMLNFINEISSDLPFLLVSTLCVWLIQESVSNDREIISYQADMILISVLCIIAFLLRTNGILLLVTLGFSQIMTSYQKKSNIKKSLTSDKGAISLERMAISRQSTVKDLILKASPYLLFFIFIVIWRIFLPEGGNSHISFLKNISAAEIRTNIFHYLDMSYDFFDGVPYPSILIGISIPLAVLGASRRFRSDYPAIIYIILTMLLYIIWPVRQRIRFLFPIFPFYFSFVFTFLQTINTDSTTWKKYIKQVISFAPVFIVILFFLYADLRVVNNRLNNNGIITSGPYEPLAQDMFSFIEDNTEPDSIIVFIKPRLMNLLTDRKSIKITDVELLSRGDYLSFYRKDDHNKNNQIPEPEVVQLLDQGDLELVYKNYQFFVYRLIKD